MANAYIDPDDVDPIDDEPKGEPIDEPGSPSEEPAAPDRSDGPEAG